MKFPNQESSGCLRSALLNLFGILFTCGVWYWFLGPKGLLVGVGAYIAMISGKVFLKVFGRVQSE
jgi:hypothetical protein